MFGSIKRIVHITNKNIGLFSTVVKPIQVTNSMQTNNELNEKSTTKLLEQLLELKPFIVKDIVIKSKKFQKISTSTIQENYECLLESGILRETLKKEPEVLAEPDVFMKIRELKELPYDINITAPLLVLPYKKLKTILKQEVITNRIVLISKLLEVEQSEACKILARRSFLLSLNMNQISDNIKLLTEIGITKADLLKDLWVLRYSTSLIKQRMDLAKKNHIEVFKTWMVRAQPEIFETYIRRRSDNKLILGDNSLAQYLSERLECTEELAKYLISKHPALQSKSLKKMNEMINFLFEYGFKPVHICRVPKILSHSVETTKKRLKELEVEGMHLDSLYILTKSQRQYMHYFESIVKTGKSKLKNT